MTMPALSPAAGRAGNMPLAVIGKPRRGEVRLQKPSAATPVEPAAEAGAAAPALIVFGRDEADRPHASWFTAHEAPLATTAAGMMEMIALPVADDALAALARKLPHGRVFASGKAFVPFVRGATFDDLVRHLPVGVTVPNRTPKPVAFDEDTRKGGSQTAGASGTTGLAGSTGGSAKPSTPAAATSRGSLPEDWSKLKAGNRVLASISEEDGWWPAAIIEDKGDGLFLLEWEGFTDWERFTRSRDHLALLHPAYKPI